MVSLAVQEDLSLAIESAEGGAVDNPVAVPLIAGAERMSLLGPEAPGTLRVTLRIGCQEGFAGIGRMCHGTEL
jgi:hypothetical protein